MRALGLAAWSLAILASAACGDDHLEVTGLRPADGATGVALNATIEITFDRPVRLAGDGSGVELWLDDQALAGTLAVDEGGGPLRFTPNRFLIAERRYRVELSPAAVAALDGTRLAERHSWSFTTLAGCQPEPSAAGLATTGPTGDGAVLIPGGRRLSPAGRTVAAGSFPMNLLAWPDRPLVAVTNNGKGLGPGKHQSVQLFDSDSGELLTTIARDRPGAFFYGLALSADGRTLYAAGGGAQQVERLVLRDDGRALEPDGGFAVSGYPAGLALDERRGLLYVGAQLDGEVVALELPDGTERWRRRIGMLPYELRLTPSGDALYVSLWARAELGAPGQVAVLDPDDGRLRTKIDVGKNPEGMAMGSDGRLFVACADADTVAVIDTARAERIASWPLGRDPSDPTGLSPAAVALDEARGRLYAACAQKNSVQVLDLADGRPLGDIPTAWYPTGVAVQAASDQVLITCGKGLGSGPKPGTEDIHRSMPGSLSLVPAPSAAALAAGHQTVRQNNDHPLTFFPQRCLDRAFPLPRAVGQPSPIKHVIFVLRENKTYDQNLGDLEGTDGDPDLVMFGEQITPNLHALAREFCNLDNFYSDIEVSVQGHYWNVAATINDYSERIWHASYRDSSRLPSTGTQQPDYPMNDFIWHQLDDAGIGFRDYGEPLGVVGEINRFEHMVDQDYLLDLGFNLYDTPDAQRVEWVLEEIEAGLFPPFVFVGLFNDHTYGRRVGKPTPQWMVAENDYATGLLVDRISHSEFWPETLIIVTEDDPQSGADHVDGHRSIALLISPYTRKGYTSSVHYSFSSLIRTYGLILGMPALNMLDASAAPVYDCFTSQPDFSPYDARPIGIDYEVNNQGMPGAWESEQMDFTEVDRAHGLGQVLWLATHPDEPLPPQLERGRAFEFDDDEDEDEQRLVLPVPLGLEPPRESRE